MNDVSIINNFADEAQPWVRPSAILDALDGHRGRVTLKNMTNDPSNNASKLLLK